MGSQEEGFEDVEEGGRVWICGEKRKGFGYGENGERV